MSAVTPTLLEVDHLVMRFGGLTALDGVSFRVNRDEIVALIGPNGAGKTTVFNCLTGFYRPASGRLALSQTHGKQYRLDCMKAYRIARDAKVIRTFQHTRLFAGMTVLENVIVAEEAGHPAPRKTMAHARDWLDRAGLLGVADRPAGELPYGAQRRLEIVRALCASPVLLCLDEPAAGLNARESEDLSALILAIRREHSVAILIIEHDMNVVMGICDRIVVLDHGVGIADGTPSEIRSNPAVIRAYLGEPQGAAAARC